MNRIASIILRLQAATSFLPAVIFITLLLTDVTVAQTTTSSATDIKTPLALTPGAPAGSYALSDFDSVNPYNGNLNFRLPLVKIGGRGSAGYTIMLALNSKRWRVRYSSTTVQGEEVFRTWTPTTNHWNGAEVGYSAGVLVGRQVGVHQLNHPVTCPTTQRVYKFTLTRLVFTTPDGTEYELRDQATNGQPQQVPQSACNNATAPGFARGRVFVTADGSSVTFISDSIINDRNRANSQGGVWFIHPSGYLLMRDGTRSRIESGRVTWIRDRNGNKVTAGGSGATDSLGRRVVIQQGVQDVAPYGLCDKIVFKGANGAERVIRVSRDSLSNTLRAGYSIQTHTQLFPGLNGAQNIIPNIFDPPDLVSSVWLPDGRRYRLFYNPYGELARVELPTGGAFEYDYTPGSGVLTGPGPSGDEPQIYRRVVERRTYSDGVTLTGKMLYSTGGITYKDANGVTLSVEGAASYISPIAAQDSLFWPANLRLYGDWTEGRANVSSVGAGGAPLRVKTTNWQQRAPVSWLSWWNSLDRGPGYPSDNPANDPRAVETITTLNDTNRVAKTTSIDPSTGAIHFDDYNNPLDVWEYDFGPGAPGALLRHTHTNYLTAGYDTIAGGAANPDPNTTIHIRNLPIQQQVFDAGGTKRAETFYEYDLYDNSPNHAPLTDCPNISGHDGAFSTGYLMRGNATGTSRALINNSGGVTGWVHNHAQYDIAGNVVKAIDSNENPTQVDFRDNYGSPDDPSVQSSENPVNNAPGELGGQVSYAFPFKITNALGHKAYTKYDYYLGRAALSEDPNGVKSNIYFNDALDRPTSGVRAIGTSAASQTVFVYNDSDSPVNGHPARSITTISDKDVFGESDSGNGLKSVALYDGLGRTFRGAAYEGSTNWTIKDTRFDALGRVSQVSNPYRAADPGSASPPANLWTTTAYDALGRATQVTTPDTATVNTEYSGNRTLVIDQAGVKRISQTDALGRLTNVWEVRSPDAASGTVSVSFPNHPEITTGYQTDYLYDSLGNLRKVIQGAQTRWFAYDSLSRLIRAANPEQNCNPNLPPHTDLLTGGSCWSTAYSYDAIGNLVSKTDARNITTNYGYDALNRNTVIDYSDTTTINPDITRFYDKPIAGDYGKGRFWHDHAGGDWVTDPNVDHTAIDRYDPLGRPLTKRQVFKHNGIVGPHYSVNQTYDLAGNVKSVTYPSGRAVDYSYDQAGRLSSFSGNLGDSPRTYADMIGYNAAGQMIKERFGTNTLLYHNQHYNNRMQLVDIRLGDSETDEWNWSRGAIALYYGTTAAASWNGFANDTDNNGNLRRQITWVPLAGGGHVHPQHDDYTYDALNRVSSFTEAQMNSGGQWTLNVASQNHSYDRYGNRWITSATGVVSNYNPTYDTGRNRIVGPGYDQNGNITSDLLTGGTMIYDAENRLVTASAGGGGTYTYDANGKRTRRTVGGLETWHVYGIGEELLAEYAANGSPNAPQKEYGYRGGQLLIIAEGGSGGGMSFVKPVSQSKSDLIGKLGPGAGGAANRIFSADEPFAALGIDDGYGSLNAGSSDSDNAGMPVRGGPRAPAEEYGDAPSTNGVGGESLAEHPSGAQPAAPQKEYGARRGLSIVTAQSISSVSPTAHQTPDSPSSLAVTLPTNSGHFNTGVTKSNGGFLSKSCRWFGFQSVSGQIQGVRLKASWNINGMLEGDGENEFIFEYSTNNGLSWTTAVFRSNVTAPASGSVDISLSPSQDLTLVQVRDRLIVRPTEGIGFDAHISGAISDIRIEVETDTTGPVISNVAAGGVTFSGATITWNTNENSDSQVEYRTNTGSWQTTALNPALVTTHSQGLSGLTVGTVYYYRVKSRDAGGNITVSGDFSFTTLSGNAAAFVSQSVPATMTAGEAYPVSVTMLNQGTTTWTPGQAYRLGSQNPQDNTTWLTTNRVGLLPGASVSPGATTTFSFVVTAPSSPGSYNFQWQMVQEGVEWFGAKTPNVAIQVVPRNDSAEFVSQTAPSVMEAGAAYSVSLTFRNTGNTTWTAANLYRLGSQNPQDNGTWGLGRVNLGAGELVLPSALKTFSFQVVAPSTPGSYNFQWRMVRDGVNWFGAASTNLVVVTFSPADTTPPTVTSSSPTGGATNVSTGANVTVTFSEAVDPATVNGSTVELRDSSNALVSATVSYNVASRTATLNPTASLALGTIYTARVRGGGTDPRVKDLVGNALAADVTRTFTTSQNGIKWLVTDHLGSTRMVIDETGSLAGIKRRDYAPFGEELSAGVGIRSAALGYGADSVRQKFTGYERDEASLDFAQARYFSSVQGRFTNPDDFWKDSHVADPQSWNKYAYVRNNPLRYVDPNGENATVTTNCKTVDGKTTCNVSITASIAIYANPGSNISQEELNKAATDMKKSIDGAWTGSFTQDGVTYNVTTQVQVSTAANAQAAMSSGAQNVIGMTPGPITLEDGRVVGAFVNMKSLGAKLTGAADTGLMDIHNVDNYAKHEFTHLLGTENKGGAVLSNTDPAWRPFSATSQDYGWGIQEATRGVNAWVNSPKVEYKNRRYGEVFEVHKPSTYSHRTTVGAPLIWWK